MAGIQKKLENVYRSTLDTYYTGDNVDVFFDNIYVDEMVNINYRSIVNNAPVYAYNSELFNSMMKGNFRVEGRFSINFKSTGYLEFILEKGDRQRRAGNYAPLGRLSPVDPQLGLNTRSDKSDFGNTDQLNKNQTNFLNAALYDPRNTQLTAAERADVRRRLRDYIWGHLKAGDELSVSALRDSLKGRYFDILLLIGNPNTDSYDVKNIVDAQIIDVSIEAAKDMPLQLVYTFIARDIDRPSQNPNPFDFVQANLDDQISSLVLGPSTWLEYFVESINKYTDVNIVEPYFYDRTNFTPDTDFTKNMTEEVTPYQNQDSLSTMYRMKFDQPRDSQLPYSILNSASGEVTIIDEINSPTSLALFDANPNGYDNEFTYDRKPVAVQYEEVAFAGIEIPAPNKEKQIAKFFSLLEQKSIASEEDINKILTDPENTDGIQLKKLIFEDFYDSFSADNKAIVDRIKYPRLLPGNFDNFEFKQDVNININFQLEKTKEFNVLQLLQKISLDGVDAYQRIHPGVESLRGGNLNDEVTLNKQLGNDNVGPVELNIYEHTDIDLGNFNNDYIYENEEQNSAHKTLNSFVGEPELKKKSAGKKVDFAIANNTITYANTTLEGSTIKYVAYGPSIIMLSQVNDNGGGLAHGAENDACIIVRLPVDSNNQDQVELHNTLIKAGPTDIVGIKELIFSSANSLSIYDDPTYLKHSYIVAAPDSILVCMYQPSIDSSDIIKDDAIIAKRILYLTELRDFLAEIFVQDRASVSIDYSIFEYKGLDYYHPNHSDQTKPRISAQSLIDQTIDLFPNVSGVEFNDTNLVDLGANFGDPTEVKKIRHLAFAIMQKPNPVFCPVVYNTSEDNDRNFILANLGSGVTKTMLETVEYQKRSENKVPTYLHLGIYKKTDEVFASNVALTTHRLSTDTDFAQLIGSYIKADDQSLGLLEPAYDFTSGGTTPVSEANCKAKYTVEIDDGTLSNPSSDTEDQNWSTYDPKVNIKADDSEYAKLFRTLSWGLVDQYFFKTKDTNIDQDKLLISANLCYSKKRTIDGTDVDTDAITDTGVPNLLMYDYTTDDNRIPFIPILHFSIGDYLLDRFSANNFYTGSRDLFLLRFSSTFDISGITITGADNQTWSLGQDKQQGIIFDINPTNVDENKTYTNAFSILNCETGGGGNVFNNYIKMTMPHIMIRDDYKSSNFDAFNVLISKKYSGIKNIEIAEMQEVHMESNRKTDLKTIGDNNLLEVPTVTNFKYNYDNLDGNSNTRMYKAIVRSNRGSTLTRIGIPERLYQQDGNTIKHKFSINMDNYLNIYSSKLDGYIKNVRLYKTTMGGKIFDLDNSEFKDIVPPTNTLQVDESYRYMRLNIKRLYRLSSLLYDNNDTMIRNSNTMQFIGYRSVNNSYVGDSPADTDYEYNLFNDQELENDDGFLVDDIKELYSIDPAVKGIPTTLSETHSNASDILNVEKTQYSPVTFFLRDVVDGKPSKEGYVVIGHNSLTTFKTTTDGPLTLLFMLSQNKGAEDIISDVNKSRTLLMQRQKAVGATGNTLTDHITGELLEDENGEPIELSPREILQRLLFEIYSNLFYYWIFKGGVQHIYAEVNKTLPSDLANLGSTELQIKKAIAETIVSRVNKKMEGSNVFRRQSSEPIRPYNANDKQAGTERDTEAEIREKRRADALARDIVSNELIDKLDDSTSDSAVSQGIGQLGITETGLANYAAGLDDFNVIIVNPESEENIEVIFAVEKGEDLP